MLYIIWTANQSRLCWSACQPHVRAVHVLLLLLLSYMHWNTDRWARTSNRLISKIILFNESRPRFFHSKCLSRTERLWTLRKGNLTLSCSEIILVIIETRVPVQNREEKELGRALFSFLLIFHIFSRFPRTSNSILSLSLAHISVLFCITLLYISSDEF